MHGQPIHASGVALPAWWEALKTAQDPRRCPAGVPPAVWAALGDDPRLRFSWAALGPLSLAEEFRAVDLAEQMSHSVALERIGVRSSYLHALFGTPFRLMRAQPKGARGAGARFPTIGALMRAPERQAHATVFLDVFFDGLADPASVAGLMSGFQRAWRRYDRLVMHRSGRLGSEGAFCVMVAVVDGALRNAVCVDCGQRWWFLAGRTWLSAPFERSRRGQRVISPLERARYRAALLLDLEGVNSRASVR